MRYFIASVEYPVRGDTDYRKVTIEIESTEFPSYKGLVAKVNKAAGCNITDFVIISYLLELSEDDYNSFRKD